MWLSQVYFSLFIIIGGFLTINLFITVVVQGYDEAMAAAAQRELLDNLEQRIGWQKMDPDGNRMVEAQPCISLLSKLQWPMWSMPVGQIKAKRTTEFVETLRQLQKMCLPLYSRIETTNGEKVRIFEVHYNDAVSSLAMKLYKLNLSIVACRVGARIDGCLSSADRRATRRRTHAPQIFWNASQ
eukprot:gene23684-54488_t